MTTILDTKTNAAWAPQETREQITAQMAAIKEAGWTRPAVLKAFGELDVQGVTDSVVWRAQNLKTNSVEVPLFERLFTAIAEGTVTPKVKATKLNAKAVVDRAAQAAALLAALGEKPSATAAREAIAAALALLPEPKVDEPDPEPEGNAGGEPEGGQPEA